MSWIYVVYVEIYRFFDWFQYTSIMLLLHDTEKKLSLWGLHTIYIFLSFLNIKNMNTRWKMFLISKVFEIISVICWGKLWKSVKKLYKHHTIFNIYITLEVLHTGTEDGGHCCWKNEIYDPTYLHHHCTNENYAQKPCKKYFCRQKRVQLEQKQFFCIGRSM